MQPIANISVTVSISVGLTPCVRAWMVISRAKSRRYFQSARAGPPRTCRRVTSATLIRPSGDSTPRLRMCVCARVFVCVCECVCVCARGRMCECRRVGVVCAVGGVRCASVVRGVWCVQVKWSAMCSNVQEYHVAPSPMQYCSPF